MALYPGRGGKGSFNPNEPRASCESHPTNSEPTLARPLRCRQGHCVQRAQVMETHLPPSCFTGLLQYKSGHGKEQSLVSALKLASAVRVAPSMESYEAALLARATSRMNVVASSPKSSMFLTDVELSIRMTRGVCWPCSFLLALASSGSADVRHQILGRQCR